MWRRLSHQSSCGALDLVRAELTILGKLENDRGQSNATGFTHIAIGKVAFCDCPHLLEDLAEHLYGFRLIPCRASDSVELCHAVNPR